ncbi:MAG: fibronectin type III domain-containing protein, partial [Mycobacteriales bacterium]
NFGMAMLADNDNGTAGTTTNNRERLASSLWTTCTSCGGNASQLPTLTVTYSPPPPPPVSSVSASASGTTISASWPASAGASTYYVETYQNGSYLTASQTSATSFAASGLPNDSYQFLVFAGNSGGWSSGTYSNTVTLAPPGPTSVSATVAGTTVEASWPAAPNATEYVASLFTASDTSSVLTTYSSSAQSASFAGLTPGAGYYVSVASCDSDGCGGSTWSNLATLAPDPPSSVSATPGTGQLSASWPAVSGATSYAASLYLDTYPSQQVASQQVGSSAVTFTGLTPGASYYVTVAACNAGGCSPATGSAVATLAPAAPASVTLTAGYLAASATWPAASGATSYATSLYLLPSPPTLVGSHTVATTSDAYSGLAPNASYELVVTACNATGCSGATTSNTVTLSPDTPASLTATGSGTTVAASWPATSGATSYLTSIATAADPAGVLASHTVTTTTDTFPGLTPGQAYQVTLAACSAAGCSPAITSGVVTLVPAPPAPVAATPGDRVVTASWPAEPGATSYAATVATAADPTAVLATSSGTATHATFPGLADGVAYLVTAAACDAGGCASATSAPVTPQVNGPSGTELLGDGGARDRPPPGGGSGAEPGANGCPTQPRCGEPVNTLTGDFYTQATDLALAGPGLGLAFTRTYNTLAAVAASAPGVLGYGWTDSYALTAAVDPSSGNVTITQGDGATVTFTPTGTGGYSAPAWVVATLSANSGGGWNFTLPDLTVDTFSAAGALVAITDRAGETTTLGYTGTELTTVTDPAGRQLTLAYNGAGELASVTDPAGRTVSYTYDSAGELTSVTDPTGATTGYGYDGAHRLTSSTNADGGVLANSYNAANQVVSQTDPLGRTTTFSYGFGDTPGCAEQSTVTDASGVITMECFYNDELTSSTRSYGGATPVTSTQSYDSAGNIATTTDALGRTTRYSWNARANLLATTDPLGRTTSYTYNAGNQVTSVTDPAGVTATYAYDGVGNLVRATVPVSATVSATTSYTYADPAYASLATSLTDATGASWQMGYDSTGELTSLTDPDGFTTSYDYACPAGTGPASGCYAGSGLMSSSTDANGDSTSYAYDADAWLVATTDADGHTTRVTYDGVGNLITSTDADGNTTTYSYDGDNEVVRVTAATGTSAAASTLYSYDSLGADVPQV